MNRQFDFERCFANYRLGLVFGMLRRTWFSLTLLLCLSTITVFAVQNEQSLPRQPADAKPALLLPPEGFDDGSGYVLPGGEWQHASPESEGFSSARLEALHAILKTHQTDAMMIVSRARVVFEY